MMVGACAAPLTEAIMIAPCGAVGPEPGRDFATLSVMVFSYWAAVPRSEQMMFARGHGQSHLPSVVIGISDCCRLAIIALSTRALPSPALGAARQRRRVGSSPAERRTHDLVRGRRLRELRMLGLVLEWLGQNFVQCFERAEIPCHGGL